MAGTSRPRLLSAPPPIQRPASLGRAGTQGDRLEREVIGGVRTLEPKAAGAELDSRDCRTGWWRRGEGPIDGGRSAGDIHFPLQEGGGTD